MPFERQGLRLAAVAAALLAATPAVASGDPVGVWVNDTGRGAIEIKQCGDKLCGHVVWVKEAADAEGCGRQIIGDVIPMDGGVWGEGWIYSPERKSNYNVEITPLSDGTLRVKGFAKLSFLSRTMIWTKAPTDLVRCSTQQEAAAPPASDTLAAPKPAERKEAAPAPEAAPPPAGEPKVAEGERGGNELDELSDRFGDVFTMKDGKCKVDTPWVKLDFECGEK